MERRDKLFIGYCLANTTDFLTTKIAISVYGATDFNPLLNETSFSSADKALMVKMGAMLAVIGLYGLSRKWNDVTTQKLMNTTLISANLVLWSASLFNTISLLSNR